MVLPSGFQIDELVNYVLMPNNTCTVHAVHFTKSKVRYDLDVNVGEGFSTRVYNVDSAFLTR